MTKITLFVGFEKRQRTGTGTEEDWSAAAQDVASKCREPTKEQTRSGARILRRSHNLLLRYRRFYHHLSPEYSSSSSRSIEFTLQVRRVNHIHIWYSPMFTDRWSLPNGLLTNCPMIPSLLTNCIFFRNSYCRLRIFPCRSWYPLYMSTHNREGCSLGLHVLPYIKRTTIRARVATKKCLTLT